MANKYSIYKAMVDLVSSMLLAMVDKGTKTVWAENKLTLVPEGEHGVFVFITYDTKTALVAKSILERAGGLGELDLGPLGDPPPAVMEPCDGCGDPIVAYELNTKRGGPGSVRCSIRADGRVCCSHLPPKLGDLRG